MRALGDPDAYPATDIALINALGRKGETLEHLKPWRAYAAIRLWRRAAQERRTQMISTIHDSPVGPLTLHSDGAALTGLEFDEPKYPLAPSPRGEDDVLDAARRELDPYFAGKLKAFDVPLAPRGTPFQQRVWAALRKIPYGATRTLRPAGRRDRLAQGVPRGGARQRQEPDLDHRPVPPRHRRRRQAHRVRRRHGAQAIPARQHEQDWLLITKLQLSLAVAMRGSACAKSARSQIGRRHDAKCFWRLAPAPWLWRRRARASAQAQAGWTYAYTDGVATATERDERGRVTATMTCRPPTGDIVLTDFTLARAARRATHFGVRIGAMSVTCRAGSRAAAATAR